MRIVIVGPGRAGGAIAIAAVRAGHDLVAVVPGQSGRIPPQLDAPQLPLGATMPPCDLVVLAVRDDSIVGVARSLVGKVDEAAFVCHLSGFASIRVLEQLEVRGSAIGSLHPLQSLLDPARGADALRGSFAAVTADKDVEPLLSDFARSIGLRPFHLADESKPAHHAAATAASNFVVSALAVVAELATEAGTPLAAYASLTRAVVDNAYEVGPVAALTGPVARGDVGTVAGQLKAAAAISDDLGARFGCLVEANARMAGRWELFRDQFFDSRP